CLHARAGWAGAPWRALPAQRAGGGVAIGARFADMDGDGVVDFVVDGPIGCVSGCEGPQVWLNRFIQGNGWELHLEFGTLPSTSSFANVQPVRLNAPTSCDLATNGSCEGFQHMTLQPAVLADMHGDGKMDLDP